MKIRKTFEIDCVSGGTVTITLEGERDDVYPFDDLIINGLKGTSRVERTEVIKEGVKDGNVFKNLGEF